MYKRKVRCWLIIGVLGVVGGCSSTVVEKGGAFLKESPIAVPVRAIQVVGKGDSSSQDGVSTTFSQMVEQWARSGLRATGSTGTFVIDVQDAHIDTQRPPSQAFEGWIGNTQQDVYHAILKVKLSLQEFGSHSKELGIVSLGLKESLSTRATLRERRLFKEGLMKKVIDLLHSSAKDCMQKIHE